MGQVDSLTRLLLLLRALSSRNGSTLRDLADELGVHTKTVRRAITSLQEAGFAVVEKTGPRGRKTWHVQTQEGLTQLTFTFDEALALYLGRRFLTPMAGTHIWTAANQAFQKIRACLGSTAVKYVDELAPRLHLTAFGAGDYSAKGEIIEQLLIGMEDHKVVHIVYQSLRSTEPVTYKIDPYVLVWHRGSLYLIGFSHNHDETRMFKVDRIQAAEKSVFDFETPADFDSEAFMSKAFGVYVGQDDITVKVRFRPAVARYVEESTWHSSQKLTRQRDGSIVAEFQLSDTREIKAWILSFGSLAEVLEPTELRQEVADELLKTFRQYASDDAYSHSDSADRPTKGG